MRFATLVRTALGAILCFPHVALACERNSPVSASEMIRDADAIVRVRASEYVTPPAGPNVITAGGVPAESRIRFSVLEVIRGRGIQKEIIFPGFLSDRDDFNDHAPPYVFVRP